jgi:hypothetical protein
MKNKYPIRAKNETGDVTVDVQEFVVPDSAITAGSGYVNLATATGDVTGPASATDTAIAVYNGTTGRIIKNTGSTITSNSFSLVNGVNDYITSSGAVGVNTYSATTQHDFKISNVIKTTIGAEGQLILTRTITPGATTGNQTIDKPAGTVNIAAAGTTVTVTNSLVTTNSLIFCTIRTNDGTAVLKNVVPGTGSFVINLTAAATAEVSIGFWVTN